MTRTYYDFDKQPAIQGNYRMAQCEACEKHLSPSDGLVLVNGIAYCSWACIAPVMA